LNRRISSKRISSGNPVANVVAAIVGMLVIGAFIVLGVFAAVALGAIILVFAAALGIRIWWLGRRLRGQAETSSERRRPGPDAATVIEGEYRVISAEPKEKRQD
jgi:hypothetical protein